MKTRPKSKQTFTKAQLKQAHALVVPLFRKCPMNINILDVKIPHPGDKNLACLRQAMRDYHGLYLEVTYLMNRDDEVRIVTRY